MHQRNSALEGFNTSGMPHSCQQYPPGDATGDCALFYASANYMDTSGCVSGLHERVSAMYLQIMSSDFQTLFPTQALRLGVSAV
jgi:hypothetical protein